MAKLLTRREFLNVTGIGMGALMLRPWRDKLMVPHFPISERLGRVTVGKLEIKA